MRLIIHFENNIYKLGQGQALVILLINYPFGVVNVFGCCKSMFYTRNQEAKIAVILFNLFYYNILFYYVIMVLPKSKTEQK